MISAKVEVSAGQTSGCLGGKQWVLLARHASANTLFSTTSLATMLPAASRDFDFSDEAPSAAAGDTGVGTDVGTGAGVVIGATAAPGGRKGLLRGSRKG